jgi:hypothetical protein
LEIPAPAWIAVEIPIARNRLGHDAPSSDFHPLRSYLL